MKEMKVLIPILSKKESDSEFLDYATKGVKEVVLLLVIDKDTMIGQFGFAATEIREGTDLLEKLGEKIDRKKKTAKEVMEWGATDAKIMQVSQLQKVDKVVMVEQDNKFFKELLGKLKDALKIPVETFEVKPKKEEEGAEAAEGETEEGVEKGGEAEETEDAPVEIK